MRISDWSSDVCSSDLRFLQQRRVDRGGHVVIGLFQDVADALVGRGQRLGLGQPGEGADGVDAAVEDVERGPAHLGLGGYSSNKGRVGHKRCSEWRSWLLAVDTQNKQNTPLRRLK